MRSALVWTAVAGLVALGLTPGRGAEMDHVLLPGDVLRTRLIVGERRSVAVAAVPGMKLSITVKRGRRSSVEPSLSIAGPDGRDVAAGKRLKQSKRTARLRGWPVARGGHWRATFSALSGGGDVDVRVAGKPPRKATFHGELFTADRTAEHRFVVLPGSQVRVKVSAKGKPAWSPAAEIVTPSGTVIPLLPAYPGPPGAKGAPGPFLDEFGEHVLRISGGPGVYGTKLKIRPPKVKGRLPQFADVEALPVLTGFSPTSVRNDDEAHLVVSGLGFSAQHSVTITSPEKGYAKAKISVTPTGGTARLDTTGIPPGRYRLGVSTSVGNARYAATPITVTNRAPAITFASSPEFPAFPDVEIRLRGNGYDADCRVELRRIGDGAVIPVTVVGRDGHTTLDLRMEMPPYQVGAYDAVLTDPMGLSQTYPGYFEVVGYRAPPVDVWELYATYGPMGYVSPQDADYDGDSDTVLLAITEESSAHFVLLDAVTLEVLQTYSVEPVSPGGVIALPRVAWNPVDDTFAMTWRRIAGGMETGNVRVCASDDLDDELSLTVVAATDEVTQVDVAPNRDDGGWLAVWEAYAPAPGSRIQTVPIAADGTIDLDDVQTVFENAAGLSWLPSIVYRRGGDFVIAHIGANTNDTTYAVRRIVVSSSGGVRSPSLPIAASSDWYGIAQPELAVDPRDGSVLLGFSYFLFDRARPAIVMLEGPAAKPESIQSTAGDGVLPEGYLDDIAWNPERGEFVLGLQKLEGDWRTLVRRVSAEGVLRPLGVPFDLEGYLAVLWSGPEPGQLGFVRGCDGNDTDDRTMKSGDYAYVRAGRIR